MKNLKSLLLLLITAMIWGFAFAAQRMGSDFVEVFTFNGIRFLLGGISLIPVILIFEKSEIKKELHKVKLKTTIFAGVLAGLALFAASALQQKGIEITQNAGKASFMTGLYTVLVPVFGVFFGKKTNLNAWIGAVLAVLGMFFLCIIDESWSVVWKISYGDVVLFLNAIGWAVHILIIDRFVDRVYPLRFALTQFLFCGALSLSCAFFTETISLSMLGEAGIPILYCGILSVGVAYTCQVIGQRLADPTYASVILSTESMFGAIGGAVVLHEQMSAPGYLGCVLIFAGVIISQTLLKSDNKKRHSNGVSPKNIHANDNRGNTQISSR